MADPIRSWFADEILDAVETWATAEYWLVRESVAGVFGRIDALLIPASFTTPVMRSRKGFDCRLHWTQRDQAPRAEPGDRHRQGGCASSDRLTDPTGDGKGGDANRRPAEQFS